MGLILRQLSCECRPKINLLWKPTERLQSSRWKRQVSTKKNPNSLHSFVIQFLLNENWVSNATSELAIGHCVIQLKGKLRVRAYTAIFHTLSETDSYVKKNITPTSLYLGHITFEDYIYLFLHKSNELLKLIQEKPLGPVDNRPSTDEFHHFVRKRKEKKWHVTHAMWHVTRDTWHVTCLGGWTFSQNVTSLALTVCDFWYYEDLEEKADWLTELIK